MEKEQIIALIERYWAGTLTPEEEHRFFDWYHHTGLEEFNSLLRQCSNLPAHLSNQPEIPEGFRQKLEQDIRNLSEGSKEKADNTRIRQVPVTPSIRRWWAAAAILLLLIPATWLLYQSHQMSGPQPLAQHTISRDDRSPGVSGAVLTLSTGNKIQLDSAGKGRIAEQGNATLLNSNGQLSYSSSSVATTEVLYNTLTTGRGNQYALVLPDGSHAWLNASSSITYPTAFTGTSREVTISGEAYFEIAAKPGQPFIVKNKDNSHLVQVLGTSFNINTYEDEDAIRTTLLEGSIKVSKDGSSMQLRPGQQSVAAKDQPGIHIASSVNTDQVMAWKNGLFHFERADIQTVMRQIARWYDVEVSYSGTISQHFGGTISRNVNVSQVFQMLEMTGAVHFKIKGRQVEVYPGS